MSERKAKRPKSKTRIPDFARNERNTDPPGRQEPWLDNVDATPDSLLNCVDRLFYLMSLLPTWDPDKKRLGSRFDDLVDLIAVAAMERGLVAESKELRRYALRGTEPDKAVFALQTIEDRLRAEVVQRLRKSGEPAALPAESPSPSNPPASNGPQVKDVPTILHPQEEMVGQIAYKDAVNIAKILLAKEHYMSLPKGHPKRKTRREVAKHFDIPLQKNCNGKQSMKAMEEWVRKPCGRRFMKEFRMSKEAVDWQESLDESSKASTD